MLSLELVKDLRLARRQPVPNARRQPGNLADAAQMLHALKIAGVVPPEKFLLPAAGFD